MAVKKRRHTPDQVVRKLREADRLLAEGKDVSEVAKHLEISEQTYHRWRNQYGGLKADDAKRLKELAHENTALKRIVADKESRDRRPQGDRKGKLLSPARRRSAVLMLQDRLELSERRVCLIVGQHRSTQRREVIRTKGDDALRARLHAFSRKHKRWGYRKAWGVLRYEGWSPTARRSGACGERRA